MKKKNIIVIILIIVIVILGLVISFITSKRKLTKSLEGLDNCTEIIIASKNINEGVEVTSNNTSYHVVANITDKEEIKEITNELKMAKIYHYSNNNDSNYLIRMILEDKDTTIDFSYSPLKLLSFSNKLSLKLNNSNYIEKLLESYNVPILEIIEKLENTNSLVIKSQDNEKVINDKDKINELLEIIENAKIWHGSNTAPGVDFEIEFLDKDANTLAVVSYKPYLIMKYLDKEIYLKDYDNDNLEKLLNS